MHRNESIKRMSSNVLMFDFIAQPLYDLCAMRIDMLLSRANIGLAQETQSHLYSYRVVGTSRDYADDDSPVDLCSSWRTRLPSTDGGYVNVFSFAQHNHTPRRRLAFFTFERCAHLTPPP